ncbi:hypothetical protein [Halorarum salinum]|uniref:DUF8156 domain-containing protein n=1 Tax=Halorarum salinum TaxID=2743089 RepID=A0A7D5LCB8_9EURY|nr:hypothetical protein [Halobaculum salinum]QLG63067.1 hypothetical protein HUG12_15535 [Halobaculum salinum]
MGKTNPTYRDRLNAWEDDWQSFRQALRAPRREYFDELLVMANELSMAAGYQNTADFATPLLVSVCVRQQEEIAALQARLDDVDTTPEVADA